MTVLWLLVPTAALAISMSPNPLPILDGEIRLLADGIGTPAGGVVLDGTVAPTDVVLLFELEQFPDPLAVLPDLDFGYSLAFPVGSALTAVGTIAGAGVDITGGAVAPTGGGIIFPGVSTGYTTDVFFIAFEASPEGFDWRFETLGGSITFDPVVFVPEPSTGLLFGIGSAALFVGRRRCTN